MVDISLKKIQFTFTKKPILVGGKAMEYHGLRKSGKDIDLIADEKDISGLIKKYPDRVKNLFGDLGVCPMNFEIWKTICFYTYDDFLEGAIDIGEVLVIAEDKLLFMKALAIKKEKYLKDVELIVEDLLKKQNEKYHDIASSNNDLLRGINVTYLEKESLK